MHLPETLQDILILANLLLLATVALSVKNLRTNSDVLKKKIRTLSQNADAQHQKTVDLSQAIESWKTGSMRISSLRSLAKTLDISKKARKQQENILRVKDKEVVREAEERISQLRRLPLDDCSGSSRVLRDREEIIDVLQKKVNDSEGADALESMLQSESQATSPE